MVVVMIGSVLAFLSAGSGRIYVFCFGSLLFIKYYFLMIICFISHALSWVGFGGIGGLVWFRI